jgi:hypothetical protein
MKFGAFLPCMQCQHQPKSEDELAISLAMTDHYFDENDLKEIAEQVREGNPPALDEESKEQLVAQIRKLGLVNETPE